MLSPSVAPTRSSSTLSLSVIKLPSPKPWLPRLCRALLLHSPWSMSSLRIPFSPKLSVLAPWKMLSWMKPRIRPKASVASLVAVRVVCPARLSSHLSSKRWRGSHVRSSKKSSLTISSLRLRNQSLPMLTLKLKPRNVTKMWSATAVVLTP